MLETDIAITKLISIDSASTNDVDDAIWIEKRLETSGYQITIYIANVANAISRNSKLEKEAIAQGFSIYRGHRGCVRPMIPRTLSEDKLSLISGQLRNVVAIQIEVDESLGVIRSNFSASTTIINSNKLSHEQADAILTEADSTSPIKNTLDLMMEVSKKLLARRRKNGALAFYDVKMGVYINEDGHLVKVHNKPLFNSYIIVQEFMILANAVCAEYFASQDIPALYRNHKVSAAAPDSRTLAAEIETALTVGDANVYDNITKRLSLVLTKASIDRTLHGHYALNLPAYTYITSPIRRLPDLVNQRILIAHLNGAETPYSNEELDQIATRYNELCREEEQNTSEAFRGLSERASKVALESNALSKLDDTEFHRVGRLLAKSEAFDTIPENFVAEWTRRAQSGLLTGIQIANAVACFKGIMSDDAFREALRYLKNNRHVAPSVWNILETKYGFNAPSLTLTNQSLDDPANTQFAYAGIFLGPDGTEYKTGSAKGRTKRFAEQNCYFRLIAKYLGISMASLAHPDEPEESNQTTIQTPTAPGDKDLDIDDNKNYKGYLFELCQKAKLVQPDISMDSKGTPPNQLFTATISVKWEDKEFVESGLDCTTKRRAEHSGAKAWLEQYKSLSVFEKTAAEKISPPVSENAISYLNEAEQKTMITNLRYDFSSEGTSFVCIVSFQQNGKSSQKKGVAQNKKEAKLIAATAAYKTLQTRAP